MWGQWCIPTVFEDSDIRNGSEQITHKGTWLDHGAAETPMQPLYVLIVNNLKSIQKFYWHILILCKMSFIMAFCTCT